MDSLHTDVALMCKDCYLALVDLRDAYFTVPIAESHRKFLSFRWKDQLYQYTVLPNGLASVIYCTCAAPALLPAPTPLPAPTALPTKYTCPVPSCQHIPLSSANITKHHFHHCHQLEHLVFHCPHPHCTFTVKHRESHHRQALASYAPSQPQDAQDNQHPALLHHHCPQPPLHVHRTPPDCNHPTPSLRSNAARSTPIKMSNHHPLSCPSLNYQHYFLLCQMTHHPTRQNPHLSATRWTLYVRNTKKRTEHSLQASKIFFRSNNRRLTVYDRRLLRARPT